MAKGIHASWRSVVEWEDHNARKQIDSRTSELTLKRNLSPYSRIWLSVFAVLSLAVIALAACGGESAGPATPAGVTTEQPTAAGTIATEQATTESPATDEAPPAPTETEKAQTAPPETEAPTATEPTTTAPKATEDFGANQGTAAGHSSTRGDGTSYRSRSDACNGDAGQPSADEGT